ncbi:MAG: DUF167 domain-containing protein [Candidatus Omnitrophica bacterium]|nr:DUF167 domain-containing protein [Candidatus Omnitrophota bacterium]
MQVNRLTVKVKVNSRVEKVERINDNEFHLKVKAPAKEGRANEAVVELLSEYFDISKSRITILKGLKSKSKTVEIIKS